MVKRLKKDSQLACSMGTFLSADRWNYCTQSAQCFHALPQNTAKSSMKFEYKPYNLCRLLGVTNYSPKD